MKVCKYCGRQVDNYVVVCPGCNGANFESEEERKLKEEEQKKDEEARRKANQTPMIGRRGFAVGVLIIVCLVVFALIDGLITKHNDNKQLYVYGAEYYDQGLMPEAIENLRLIPTTSMYYDNAQNLLKNAEISYLEDVNKETDLYINKEDLPSAVKTLRNARELLPDNDELNSRFLTYSEIYKTQVMKDAKESLKTGNGYYKAMKILKEAKGVLEDDPAIRSTIEKYKEYRPHELTEEEAYEINEYAIVGQYNNIDNYRNTYEGVVVSAESRGCTGVVSYYLGNEYDVMEGTIFVPYDQRNYSEEDIEYSEDLTSIKVYGDGDLLYTARKIYGKDKPYDFTIDVSDCEFIEIRTIGGEYTGLFTMGQSNATMCLGNLTVSKR